MKDKSSEWFKQDCPATSEENRGLMTTTMWVLGGKAPIGGGAVKLLGVRDMMLIVAALIVLDPKSIEVKTAADFAGHVRLVVMKMQQPKHCLNFLKTAGLLVRSIMIVVSLEIEVLLKSGHDSGIVSY